MAGRVADSAAGLPARSQANPWPRSLSRRRGSRLPARLTLPRPLLDVRAGLTSGHAFVKPNGCEADVEQSRCRLFAPAEVPAATRAAPRRPCIPQAVQTPAIVELTHVVRQRGLDHHAGPVVADPGDASRRETDFVASSLVSGRARGREKQAGGACRRTSPRRMVQPRRRPLPGRPASRARTRCRAVAGQICIASRPASGFPEGRCGDRCHAGAGGGRRHRPATALRRALARS